LGRRPCRPDLDRRERTWRFDTSWKAIDIGIDHDRIHSWGASALPEKSHRGRFSRLANTLASMSIRI
jgi:hypothetical protein